MADARTLAELGRDVARNESDIREIREKYVRLDVYRAELTAAEARIKRLEDEDTSKSVGNRAWLLQIAGTIFGVIASAVVTVLIARGGH